MFLFLCPESYPDDKYINECILRSHPVKFFVKKNSHPNSCNKISLGECGMWCSGGGLALTRRGSSRSLKPSPATIGGCTLCR